MVHSFCVVSGTTTYLYTSGSMAALGAQPPPQDFFKIMQFSGYLSKLWAQGPNPLGSKLRWAPLTKILDPRLLYLGGRGCRTWVGLGSESYSSTRHWFAREVGGLTQGGLWMFDMVVTTLADPGGSGAPLPPPRFFSKSCSFRQLFKKRNLFSANFGLRPPFWGQNSTGPPPKSWIHAWTACLAWFYKAEFKRKANKEARLGSENCFRKLEEFWTFLEDKVKVEQTSGLFSCFTLRIAEK